jgi:hypothetical protein
VTIYFGKNGFISYVLLLQMHEMNEIGEEQVRTCLSVSPHDAKRILTKIRIQSLQGNLSVHYTHSLHEVKIEIYKFYQKLFILKS